MQIDDKRIFRLWGEVENPDSKKIIFKCIILIIL